MSIHQYPRRIPRARIDPIASADDALVLVRTMLAAPPRSETVVIVLDDAHCGLTIVSVADTDQPDDVVGVVECLALPDLADRGVAALIVATARPGGGVVDDDIDRWFEICDLADAAGLELLEWFVVGRSISCPRDLIGAPPRWSGGAARSA